MELNKDLLSKKLANIISEEGWNRFQDIHIDEIYDDKLDFDGISLGIEALLYSHQILSNQYELMLAISFKNNKFKAKVDNLSIKQLEKLIDETPPSLYLYPVGYFPFEESLRLSSAIRLTDENRVSFFARKDENVIYAKPITK